MKYITVPRKLVLFVACFICIVSSTLSIVLWRLLSRTFFFLISFLSACFIIRFGYPNYLEFTFSVILYFKIRLQTQLYQLPIHSDAVRRRELYVYACKINQHYKAFANSPEGTGGGSVAECYKKWQERIRREEECEKALRRHRWRRWFRLKHRWRRNS